MLDPLVLLVLLACAASLAFAAVDAVRDRQVGEWQLRVLLVLTVALLVQAVVAGARIAGGTRPAELAVFVSYLVAVVLLPPVAAVWGRGEGGRWGSAVVAVGSVAVAVMVLRLQQLWSVRGG